MTKHKDKSLTGYKQGDTIEADSYKYLLDLKELDKLTLKELLDKGIADAKNFSKNMSQEIANKIFASKNPLKEQPTLDKVAGRIYALGDGEYGIQADYIEELWYFTRRILWGGSTYQGGHVFFKSKEALEQYWNERRAVDYSKMNLQELLEELEDVARHVDLDTWGINDWNMFLRSKGAIFDCIQVLLPEDYDVPVGKS